MYGQGFDSPRVHKPCYNPLVSCYCLKWRSVTGLRRRVESPVEVTREDVLRANCSFALSVFDKLAAMEPAETGKEYCYACLAMFTRDPDGRIFFTGKCISTLSSDRMGECNLT